MQTGYLAEVVAAFRTVIGRSDFPLSGPVRATLLGVCIMFPLMLLPLLRMKIHSSLHAANIHMENILSHAFEDQGPFDAGTSVP